MVDDNVHNEKKLSDAEILTSFATKFGKQPFVFKRPSPGTASHSSTDLDLNKAQVLRNDFDKNGSSIERKIFLSPFKNGGPPKIDISKNNDDKKGLKATNRFRELGLKVAAPTQNNTLVLNRTGVLKDDFELNSIDKNGTLNEMEPTNKNINNDGGDNMFKASKRFREAGMKAKLARRMEKILDERMTVTQIFNRYVDNSTLHGFRYIFMDTFWIRRFLWFALLVTFSVIFLNELKNSILLYYQYPFTTTSTTEYVPELNFPAISICNLNQFDESKIKRSNLSHLYGKGGIPFNSEYLSNIEFNIDGQDLAAILDSSSQKIENIFKGCEWKRRDTARSGQSNFCTASNFTVYQDLFGQNCFTFNSGKTDPVLHLNETGLNMALKLEFDLDTDQSLKNLQEFGLKIVIHDQNESPLQQAGFVVSPGLHSFVELKVRKTENLKPPYGTKCGKRTLMYHDEYRQSRCFLEQLSKKIVEKCGCGGKFMPRKGLPYCSLNSTINCLLPVVYDYDRRTNLDCPVDCNTVDYITSLSYARFLSSVSDDDKAHNEMFSTYIHKLKKNMTGQKLKQYIEENVVVVQFFYQEMKEENVIQEPSYDFYKLVGDVGGQLGLMLGASVLTLAEFVDLFIFTLYHQILRLWRRKKT